MEPTAMYKYRKFRPHALYRARADCSFLEKNARGFYDPSSHCCSTAPATVFDVSLAMEIGTSCYGCMSSVELERAFLMLQKKACSASSVRKRRAGQCCGLHRSSSGVRKSAIEFGIKQPCTFSNPRNCRSFVVNVERGKPRTTSS